MPYGSALGVVAPTVTVTVGPDYATDVNAYLDALRAVVEAKVTPGGFNMNTDLSFLASGTHRSAVDLLTAAFEVQDAAGDIDAPTFPAALFTAGVDGDLFFNDAAGNQIQVTTAGTLNVSAAGGITGTGYGSGGVAVNFNAGLLGYRFFVGTDVYGDVICDDLLLNDGDTNFISIVSPPLATDYTIELPDAPPATSAVMLMQDDGTITVDPTDPISVGNVNVIGGVEMSGGLIVGTISTLTGDVTMGDDLTVTDDVTIGDALTVGGLSTLDDVVAQDVDVLSLDVGAPGIISVGGLLCGVDSTVTVSGTGRLVHGDFIRVIPASAFVMTEPTDPNVIMNATVFYDAHLRVDGTPGSEPNLVAPLILDVGKKVRNLQFSYFGQGEAGTRTAKLVRTQLSTDTVTDIVVGTSTTASGVVTIEILAATLAATGFDVITDGFQYNLTFTGQGDPSSAVGDFFKACRVVYSGT